ncbi:MAG: hypothetical protein HYY63_04095, partial [Elusimicrobia bacterium]|nr:hypothetical protein [Elusimicrobiota bacterium]
EAGWDIESQTRFRKDESGTVTVSYLVKSKPDRKMDGDGKVAAVAPRIIVQIEKAAEQVGAGNALMRLAPRIEWHLTRELEPVRVRLDELSDGKERLDDLSRLLEYASTPSEMADILGAFNRGQAARRYLAETNGKSSVDLQSSLISDGGGVLSVDVRPENHQWAAGTLVDQVLSRQGEGAPKILLNLDVPEEQLNSELRSFELVLDSFVREGKITASQLKAVKEGWLALSRSDLERAGIYSQRAGRWDSVLYHSYIRKRTSGTPWQLGKKFILAILTDDERSWLVSGKDYIQVIWSVTEGMAVVLTPELEEYIATHPYLSFSS